MSSELKRRLILISGVWPNEDPKREEYCEMLQAIADEVEALPRPSKAAGELAGRMKDVALGLDDGPRDVRLAACITHWADQVAEIGEGECECCGEPARYCSERCASDAKPRKASDAPTDPCPKCGLLASPDGHYTYGCQCNAPPADPEAREVAKRVLEWLEDVSCAYDGLPSVVFNGVCRDRETIRTLCNAALSAGLPEVWVRAALGCGVETQVQVAEPTEAQRKKAKANACVWMRVPVQGAPVECGECAPHLFVGQPPYCTRCGTYDSHGIETKRLIDQLKVRAEEAEAEAECELANPDKPGACGPPAICRNCFGVLVEQDAKACARILELGNRLQDECEANSGLKVRAKKAEAERDAVKRNLEQVTKHWREVAAKLKAERDEARAKTGERGIERDSLKIELTQLKTDLKAKECPRCGLTGDEWFEWLTQETKPMHRK